VICATHPLPCSTSENYWRDRRTSAGIAKGHRNLPGIIFIFLYFLCLLLPSSLWQRNIPVYGDSDTVAARLSRDNRGCWREVSWITRFGRRQCRRGFHGPNVSQSGNEYPKCRDGGTLLMVTQTTTPTGRE
ncbi:hypothetical protein BO79DRAFT_268446, partial [Aspergillus costaricaensis CBS 115574]